MSRFSVEFGFSQSAEKFRRVTVLCCVSEGFWSRKSLWIRGRGKYQDFLLKIFCLTVSKSAVGEPFSLSSISGIKKLWMREWGGGSVKFFRRKLFVSQCRKISYGNPSMLCFRKILVAKKFMDKRGEEV